MAEPRTAAFSLTWGYFNDREGVKENFLPLSFWPLPTSSRTHRISIWDFLESRFAAGRSPKPIVQAHACRHTHSYLHMCTLLVHIRHTKRKKQQHPLKCLAEMVLPHASTRAKPHKGEEKKTTPMSCRDWVTMYFHRRRTLEVFWLAAVRWLSHSGCELVQILCAAM